MSPEPGSPQLLVYPANDASRVAAVYVVGAAGIEPRASIRSVRMRLASGINMTSGAPTMNLPVGGESRCNRPEALPSAVIEVVPLFSSTGSTAGEFFGRDARM